MWILSGHIGMHVGSMKKISNFMLMKIWRSFTEEDRANELNSVKKCLLMDYPTLTFENLQSTKMV